MQSECTSATFGQVGLLGACGLRPWEQSVDPPSATYVVGKPCEHFKSLPSFSNPQHIRTYAIRSRYIHWGFLCLSWVHPQRIPLCKLATARAIPRYSWGHGGLLVPRVTSRFVGDRFASQWSWEVPLVSRDEFFLVRAPPTARSKCLPEGSRTWFREGP